MSGRLVNLDRHLSFYLQYHQDATNQLIHLLCVWPIMWTFLALLRFAGPTSHLLAEGTPEGLMNDALVLHPGWAFAGVYVVLYPLMEPVVGMAAAVLEVMCLLSANAFVAWTERSAAATELPLSPAACVGLVFVGCWVAQFYGHAVHEKRSPALLDNLFQALLAAPLFVLLKLVHYPPDVFARVQPDVDRAVAEFRAKQARKEK